MKYIIDIKTEEAKAVNRYLKVLSALYESEFTSNVRKGLMALVNSVPLSSETAFTLDELDIICAALMVAPVAEILYPASMVGNVYEKANAIRNGREGNKGEQFALESSIQTNNANTTTLPNVPRLLKQLEEALARNDNRDVLRLIDILEEANMTKEEFDSYTILVKQAMKNHNI